ncbi:hypothetical protein FA13DRAFT_1683361 [Coprinellus micaceus]|uniref:Zn(2)-C6 fungal-type domain-containing protein n=1 Tax=Coprinellus micaceus TaxID=71717 RepID=A0A4Y7TPE3_COPMI|nr:hypothetical protein FA13DRAFT_1683361 [Coprinellus micaceus]
MDIDPPSAPPAKPPVVRGARACTVCRTAKMKCVGAEDGSKPCQRCKRANTECVFEKHRRGRKPGSKLSEASKMLRRLEKGLNTAKLKSQSAEAPPLSAYPPQEVHGPVPPQEHLPPISIPPYQNGDSYPSASNGPRNNTTDLDEEDEDGDKTEESFYPAKLIKRENQRNSFFRTILNPEEAAPARSPSHPNAPPRIPPTPAGPLDPISSGLLTEEDAKMLFDLLFLRLNPFINLFDPALHTAPYVRSKCPFLFTTLIMVCCKFWRPNLFKSTQKLANEFAVRAFAEAWKRVEVVQAFACLTYWKEPDDNRTWTYVGYACRMAVELGLNKFVAHLPPNETDFQKLERRNRERTYLVLFVHDRSLSTQTGRHWMLPEGDLVKYSTGWHLGGIKGIVRPEDVIIAAFVQLRLIAAETTDIFASNKGNTDINYEVVLRNCNNKLTAWDDTWRKEMVQAKGETFHFSFLSFFRLYVRLFLNSFGIQASLLPGSRTTPTLGPLTSCYTSALDSLQIVSDDFVKMSMLCYTQDSITVMTAYSAVFLLKLLQTPTTYSQIGESTANDIYSLISKTADSYYEASNLSPVATSAAYHARFLQSLLANDIFQSRRPDGRPAGRNDNRMPIDPRLQNQPAGPSAQGSSQAPYPHQGSRGQGYQQFPASPSMQAHGNGMNPGYPQQSPQQPHPQEYSQSSAAAMSYYDQHHPGLPTAPSHASQLDQHYWKNMFIELGFGEHNETQTNVLAHPQHQAHGPPPPPPQQYPPQQGPVPYHQMHQQQVPVHPQYSH